MQTRQQNTGQSTPAACTDKLHADAFLLASTGLCARHDHQLPLETQAQLTPLSALNRPIRAADDPGDDVRSLHDIRRSVRHSMKLTACCINYKV
jgi:hypothetical protein